MNFVRCVLFVGVHTYACIRICVHIQKPSASLQDYKSLCGRVSPSISPFRPHLVFSRPPNSRFCMCVMLFFIHELAATFELINRESFEQVWSIYRIQQRPQGYLHAGPTGKDLYVGVFSRGIVSFACGEKEGERERERGEGRNERGGKLPTGYPSEGLFALVFAMLLVDCWRRFGD